MPKNIIRLIVFITKTKTQKVGTLAIRDKKIYFEYDKAFLKTGIELSPYKLPLKAGLFVCEDDTFEGLWGLFNDSLPDGWGRLLMDRHLMGLGVNPNSLTPLDRLAYVGQYAMGALSYEPEKDTLDLGLDEIVLDDLAKSSEEILEGSTDSMVDELLALGGSSGGARPKVLVQLSSDHKEIVHGKQKLKEGFSHYMVKFASSQDSREIGAIEYAYSLMVKEAGLEMPCTVLLEGKKGKYFAVERFDRVGDAKVHMHTVAGLTHSDFRFPTLDYDDLLRLTLHLTKSIVEVEKMFRLACFNLFAHNRDDHAKNFSFLMDESGEWRLSPMYDITFSYGPGGEHSTMYLGEGKNPTKKNLLALATKHGLKNAMNTIDEVVSAVQKWKEFGRLAGVSRKNIESISQIHQKVLENH
ncbi:type II toxin-antitoxin system HipA family toxin [Sulfurovum sp.]|uniref:type II toxin-antitoxin system HipA family toxin n=1 Tax=Sulfurovum sp. TaxID=1969726 RepID=UPI0026013F7A|nr:type II toxin-antitoxin system HipA family toxin [Sulfurovum sp.]